MNTIARCNALIDDALAKGARLLTGGRANDTHMSPTLLDGVTREMRLWREESFGPVKAIIRVHSEEEALAVANDSEYGLSAAVYSRDSARAWNVAQRLHTGICHINGPTVHDEAQMPFGGCKASGYGRFGGRAGIAEFTELRWITIQTQPASFPSEAQRLLTMAGDKLRQPAGFPTPSSVRHGARCRPGSLVPERGRYPHKEATALRRSAFSGSAAGIAG